MHKKLRACVGLVALLTAAPAATEVAPSAVAVKQGELWGIMDLAGNWKAPPRYARVFYSDDDAVFSIEDTNGRHGLADETGEWVLQPQFDQLWYMDSGQLIGAKQGECWGFVDRKGAWVIPPRFDAVDNFEPFGVAAVRAGRAYGLVDSRGNWIVEPKFAYISNFNKNGIAFASVVPRGKTGLINQSGEWIVEPVFDEGYFFGADGWAAVQLGAKFGYLDERGRIAFQMTLDEMPGTFQGGIALASQNGKKGFINKRGDWVMPPILEEARYPHDGLAPAKLNGKWGLIDRNGKWALPPRYDAMGWFDAGEPETWAELDGTSGFIDRKGRFKTSRLGKITPDKRIALNAHGWAPARMNGKWGVLNSSGRWLIPPRYDCVEMCWDDGPPAIQVTTATARCGAARSTGSLLPLHLRGL